MQEPPDFIAESDLLRGAYELARSAHHGPAREGDTEIDHPVAVAELLHDAGFDEHVVAAALLHDVVEDTSLDIQAIAESFGQDIARLVSEMTEDARIEPYQRRKAEHRARVSQDRRAAAIYAADKLATAKELDGPEEVPPEKLQHYLQTLETLCETNPELPFLGELRAELSGLVEASD
jgi:GTP diphosphokinase / guanosine-3',5'-bis(diphosphate) 3'-diphosphatase